MRKFTLIILILIIGQTIFGQSLFFESLPNSIWISEENFSENKLVNLHKIPLSKLTVSKDSINKNVTLWTFTDSIIKISNYDCLLKKDSLIETCKYSILPEPLLLEIYLNRNVTLQFETGMTSTGYDAILFRTKDIYACFKIIVDIKNATKDGIYMNGYVVNVPYENVEKLNGKTVQISGKVTVIPRILDKKNRIIKQERNEDTKHIHKPKIKVTDNQINKRTGTYIPR